MSIESENIKKLRKEFKLTQQQLADSICVSKQYLSRVENDITELSKEKAVILCNNYGVSINWFMLNRGPMFLGDIEEHYKSFKDNVENILDANLNLKVFSKYIEAANLIIKKADSNATLENIITAARVLFIKDFSIRKLKFAEVKSALEKFEKETKNSEEFKTKILEEYYIAIIEK